jgi:hypothetical protein
MAQIQCYTCIDHYIPHVAKTFCLFKHSYTTKITLKPCDLESEYKAYKKKCLQPKPFLPNVYSIHLYYSSIIHLMVNFAVSE